MLLVSSALRIDRKKDKAERKILDSQERAFWDVHRPVVSSGKEKEKGRKTGSGVATVKIKVHKKERKKRGSVM